MASVKDISEPVKAYKQIKEVHHQNVVDFFDELIKNSGTNVEANKATCADYYKKLADIEVSNKEIKKKKRKKNFMTFLCVLCFITIILIPLGIYIRNYIKKKINETLSDIDKAIQNKTNEANKLKADAENQLANLNSLYDWNMAAMLVSKTLPLIQMDQFFDNKRFAHLHDKYGYGEHTDNDVSTVHVQSGTILGNPFVIEKNYVCDIVSHTYTGTLVIHWTSRVSDGRGGYTTVTHTQTLVAHLTKPKPMHYLDTWLVYGNAAAPSLNFSRHPSGANGKSDKEIARSSKSFSKELEKIGKKDINFTPMSNTEFENLFHAIDRDNEVEFRLLFTPLAQKNMLDLIKMREPYGDDFTFVKRKCLNYIKTQHSQGVDFSSNPNIFINFDVEKAREIFINYCDAYMQSFFFDLAPLITIPLYQNYKDQEFIYRDNHKGNFTSFEVESLANGFDRKLFAHPETATEVILKSKLVKSQNGVDMVNITAHSFKSVPHVDLVPVLGGDGRMHPVPVHWVEYVAINKVTPFAITSTNMDRPKYLKNASNNLAKYGVKNVYYQKGLIGGLVHNSNK